MKALSLLAHTPYLVHTLPEVEPALEWILAHVGVPYGERHRRFIDSAPGGACAFSFSFPRLRGRPHFTGVQGKVATTLGARLG